MFVKTDTGMKMHKNTELLESTIPEFLSAGTRVAIMRECPLADRNGFPIADDMKWEDGSYGTGIILGYMPIDEYAVMLEDGTEIIVEAEDIEELIS